MANTIWDKLTVAQKKALIRRWLRTYPPQVFFDQSIRGKAVELGMDWDEEVFKAKQDRLKTKAAEAKGD